jgi:predicted GNAT family acetyltransferase
LRVVTVDTAEQFADRVAPMLLADEARNNLAFGILSTIVARPDLYPEERFWLVEDDGAVVAAALHTSPFNLVFPRPLDDGAIAVLAASIECVLPGVTAAVPEAHAFADSWCSARQLRPRVRVEQGIFALERVRRVSGVAGGMRAAEPADRPLVAAWFHAFAAEALESAATDVERAIDARLGGGDRAGIALWEDGGEIVSLAGFGGETPHGIRIGPVYTPPERRGRGYASALTAALSAQLLAGGRRFCFLYTNLANLTANKIYRAIGYEQVCESAEIVFEPAG